MVHMEIRSLTYMILLKTDDENLNSMIQRIYELGPSNVSKHCYSAAEYKKVNIIDISRSSLSSPDDFITAIKKQYPKIII